VKGTYDDLRHDLELDPPEVPLLAAERVHEDPEGRCAGFNELVARLPEVLPQSHVISSAGCPPEDRLHFDPAGSPKLVNRSDSLLPVLLGILAAGPARAQSASTIVRYLSVPWIL
jgi:hypothetical protein